MLYEVITLNATFLAMAISAGMTCAITNPLEESLLKTVLAANVFMGLDENCMAWLKAQREFARRASGDEGERVQRRRTRREGR